MGNKGAPKLPPIPTPPPMPPPPTPPPMMMPPIPQIPEAPQITQVPEVDWKKKREKLRADAEKEWKKKFKRQQGRLSTVLTGREDWEEKPKTIKNKVGGPRKKDK